MRGFFASCFPVDRRASAAADAAEPVGDGNGDAEVDGVREGEADDEGPVPPVPPSPVP
jgi:hypothetical protein